MTSSHKKIWLSGLATASGIVGVLLTIQLFHHPYRAESNRKAASVAAWHFAVSGDSRNCGNIVMPAIAQGALAHEARFYWHLGDFRATSRVDEDLAHDPQYAVKPLSLADYPPLAWKDFVDNQLKSFGDLPLYLAIGNHETLPPHNREEYHATFRQWLLAPAIQQARTKDGEDAQVPLTYYHWVQNGVDFITLDNASSEQFDAAQMAWFRKVIMRDTLDTKITTIVLGMHAALPDSISFSHSMSQSKDPTAIESGREVYHMMLKARDEAHKQVYILASHSHFFMNGTFNTPYWNQNGGVLPGWIVGTAGAERMPLPKEANQANQALEKVYGYLLATVEPADGTVRFEFQNLSKSDIPQAISQKYGAALVDFCFDQNSQTQTAPPVAK